MAYVHRVPFTSPTNSRVPPHNFEAEMALLGAIMANVRALDMVADILEPRHFADARHREVYKAACDLYAKGHEPNPITLKNHFEVTGSLVDIGGPGYLALLASSIVTIINSRDYAQTIIDRWLRRRTIVALEEGIDALHDMTIGLAAVQVVENIERDLFKATTMRAGDDRVISMARVMGGMIDTADAAAKGGLAAGITTGLSTIDDKIGAMRPGNLIYIGARPSMGKTTLAVNIALHVARTQGAVYFYSGEMNADEIGAVMQAQLSGIPAWRVLGGRFTVDEFGKIQRAAEELKTLPIYFDEQPGAFVTDIRSRARRVKPKLLIGDYIQIMGGGSPDDDNRRTVDRVSNASRLLKQTAKDLGCPIIALSQLSRQTEGRDDRRPQMGDLKESGSIEQDADGIWLLYRDDYYLERAPDHEKETADWQAKMEAARGVVECQIAKYRLGRVGTAFLDYNPVLSKFGVRDDNLDEQAAAYIQERMDL